MCSPRSDVIFLVKKWLAEAYGDRARLFSAPFEADHQLVSLVNQGVADFIWTEDGNIIVAGSKNTLLKHNKGGAEVRKS